MSRHSDRPRVIGFPGRYLQGRGALDRLGELVAGLGANPLILADPFVWPLLEKRVQAALAGRVDRFQVTIFGGECTHQEVDRVADVARSGGCDLVIGLGGGKTLDTAKASTLKNPLSLVIVPTIASNDAPVSRLAVIYSQSHELKEVLRLPANPDLVLVDTGVIASAPARFLVSGMGDALPTKFEAEQSLATAALNLWDGRQTYSGMVLADLSYRLIRENGLAAKLAVERGLVTEAVELVVEANILLSGLGFESGGLACAHALTRGTSATPEMHGALHGEEVAFGLLVQLVLENRPLEFIEDLLEFYGQVGLPRTLADLGLSEPTEDHYRLMAEKSCQEGSHIYKMAVPVDQKILIDALKMTEALGQKAAGRAQA